jgi:4-carboxymuconolactone decarboxylase
MERLTAGQDETTSPSKTGAPVDVGRRILIKAALASSVLAFLRAEPLNAKGIMMAQNERSAPSEVLTYDDVRSVSPALEHYTKTALLDGVWKRPELTPRDRSLITIAALVARIQTIEMPFHFAFALDNGVTPAELSEIITHLAFYAGWANAMSAVAIAKEIFHVRGIGPEQLPPVKAKPLPLNAEAERQRATQVANNFGAVSPGLVQNTTDVLFRDLWLRPALSPRDRSLITVSALIANGQTGQITYHLGRAMDNGLTASEAGELVTHLAFYAGWPNAFSAVSVVKEVVEKRPK